MSETVSAEVSRVKEASAVTVREIAKAAANAANEYERLFSEATRNNQAEFNKLMQRRNVIDIVVVIAAALAFGLTAVFWYYFFKRG